MNKIKIMKALSSLRFDLIFIRLFKIFKLIKYPQLIKFALKGVVPSFEHDKYLKKIKYARSIIDCGSNKGQFSILAFAIHSIEYYLSFDPIIEPLICLDYFKSRGVKTKHFKSALSNKQYKSKFYITERDDSSSLKKTLSIASNYFQDVKASKEIDVDVITLDSLYNIISKMPAPIILKIDVQGNEYELLEGSEKILNLVDYIFIECTYFELYEDIKYDVNSIHKLLTENNFLKVAEYNKLNRLRKLISADRLYTKVKDNQYLISSAF